MVAELEQFVVKVALTAETKEMRHLNRALRHVFAQYRRKVTPQTIAHLILKYFPDTYAEKSALLAQLPHESIEVRSFLLLSSCLDFHLTYAPHSYPFHVMNLFS